MNKTKTKTCFVSPGQQIQHCYLATKREKYFSLPLLNKEFFKILATFQSVPLKIELNKLPIRAMEDQQEVELKELHPLAIFGFNGTNCFPLCLPKPIALSSLNIHQER